MSHRHQISHVPGTPAEPEHHEATKERLLDAAGHVFADHGFVGGTVRDICRRAEANLAAVNYHFGDKERLYEQAVIAAHHFCMEPSPEGLMGDLSPAETLRLQVHYMLKSILAVDKADSWQHALMIREMVRPTEASAKVVEEVIRPRFAAIAGTMKRLRPDLEGRKFYATVFSLIGQCLLYKMARGFTQRLIGEEAFSQFDIEFLSDHITQFTLSAALGCDDARPVHRAEV